VQVKDQADAEQQAPPATRGAEHTDDGDPNGQQQPDTSDDFRVAVEASRAATLFEVAGTVRGESGAGPVDGPTGRGFDSVLAARRVAQDP
jgi:hypothetical protein